MDCFHRRQRDAANKFSSSWCAIGVDVRSDPSVKLFSGMLVLDPCDIVKRDDSVEALREQHVSVGPQELHSIRECPVAIDADQGIAIAANAWLVTSLSDP